MYKSFSTDPYIKLKSITENEFNRNGFSLFLNIKLLHWLSLNLFL